jgi:hypothetical protein
VNGAFATGLAVQAERYERVFPSAISGVFVNLYLTYEDRHRGILYPVGRELERQKKLHPMGGHWTAIISTPT